MKKQSTYNFNRGSHDCPVRLYRCLLVLVILMYTSGTGYGQGGNAYTNANKPSTAYTIGKVNTNEVTFEETSITLHVPGAGKLELPVLIYNTQVLLSVKDLFDFLKIRNQPSTDMDSLAGFFINPDAGYLIDQVNTKIIFRDKIFNLRPNTLIQAGGTLYLDAVYLDQIFGLTCVFDLYNLSGTLDTKAALPVIREMQLQLMHKNMSELLKEKIADTIIPRKFPLFHIGTADWSVMLTQATKEKPGSRINLGIGGLIACGEFRVTLDYNSKEKFNLKKQFYQWRYVNNTNTLMRQVTAGRLFTASISTLYAPLNGIQVTNTPTTYRRSFGTYRISNKTEPGWMVELYVNNVLVNFIKADASGFYTFEVPLVYGNSSVKLRFYGPWGEENIREEQINIPFNFLPVGKFEYNLSAGIAADEVKSRFTRGNFNYGLGRRITLGGGVEYFSSVNAGQPMPFINASARLGQHLLISGEHDYGIRSRVTANYRLPSNIQMDLAYTKYKPGQTAIKLIYLEERRLMLSVPFRTKKIMGFSRFTYSRLTAPKYKYSTAELVMSVFAWGISSNFTTYALFSNSMRPEIYSNLSFTLQLPKSVRLTAQVQYQYKEKRFSTAKTEVEKRLGRLGFLNVSYEKNLIRKLSLVNVGLRLNFSFAQTSFSVSRSNQVTTSLQSARGSILYDSKTNYLGFNDLVNVGKGGLIIAAFLDINCNGLRDPGEPKVSGLRLRINGGTIKRNILDSTIQVTGLEAYSNYFIEMDNNNFENVAWQILKKTISVHIEPNNLKMIEVPVAVWGEVSGNVSMVTEEGKKGIGRILLNIYNNEGVLVAKITSESDGYFSFMGLAPGTYTAKTDAVQLRKLQVTATQPLTFIIISGKDGGIADGLQFVLQADKLNK